MQLVKVIESLYLQFCELGKVNKRRHRNLAYHVVTQIPEMDDIQQGLAE